MKTELDYNTGEGLLPKGAFRISPSQFNTFMTRPHVWYREQVLGEEGFTGNTASVLGTVVHYVAECVGKLLEPSIGQIELYISKFEGDEDVDCSIVRNSYKQMAETLVNDYVLKNMPTEVEPFVKYELQPNYYPSGSIDAISRNIDYSGDSYIVDYKTYNSKTKPRKIPMKYMYQLLIYAYICRKNDKHIDAVRLVYINRNIDGGISEKTGNPLKSYPPEVTVLTETITDEDMEFIESLLNLCIDTVQTAKSNPELVYMLFRDYRLKLNK